MSTIEHVHEKVLASALLSEAAGKGSSALDKFSGWLLGGFAAVLAFLVGNVGDLQAHLPVSYLKQAGGLFLVAAVLGVIGKYIAAILSGAAEASAAGRQLGEKFADLELDFKIVFGEAKKAAFPPFRWLVGRSFTKAQAGDLAASARNCARWAQVQGLLVVVQAALVLWAVSILLRGLIT